MESPGDLSNEENCYIENEDFQHITQKLLYQKWKYKWGKKKSKAERFLTLKKPLSSTVWWVHFTVSDKMAACHCLGRRSLRLPATWRKSVFLLPVFATAPSALVSCSSFTLGASAKRPSQSCTAAHRSEATTSLSWLFPHLCPPLPPILQAISVCPCWATFTVLSTHWSTCRKIQTEATSLCVSGEDLNRDYNHCVCKS